MAVLTAFTPDVVLERDYARLRGPTLAAVRSRLRSAGVIVPDLDLEAFYNQAWHALYERMVAGEEIHSHAGFLVEVTYRRAVDELRRARPDERAELDDARLSGGDDVVERLDDRRMVRELVAALRDELDERERVAASLCYVHGYSRAEAAEAMGLSPGRMKKVMDEVSRTVARFTAEIRAGERCAVGASRTKAYALGLLDPEGERYRAARAHLDECPACRADVLRLRGLAAIATPALLPWAKLAVAGAGAGAAGAGAGATPAGSGTKAARQGQRAARVAAAAAAAVVVAVGAIALRGDDGEQRPAAAEPPTAPAPAQAGSGGASSSASASVSPSTSPRERGRQAATPIQKQRSEPGARGRDRTPSAAAAPAARSPAPAAASAPAAPAAAAPRPAAPAAAGPKPARAPEPAARLASPASEASAAPDESIDPSGIQEFGLEP
jgi:RNA polymerase sigma factor (sigma-70 family)